MPIIDVEIVARADGAMPRGLAQSLADAVGRVLESPPAQTWVRVRLLARDHYAENESLPESAEGPVFVTVLKRQLPRRQDIEAEIAALAGAVAGVVGRPVDRVHVEYAPAAAGRLAFGGKLVR